MELLKVDSLEETIEKLYNEYKKNNAEISTEEINVNDSFDRVLAEDVKATINVPEFDRSTVDGYAVIASDTGGASESVPTFLKDKDGYFEVLYANSQKSPEYADKLAKFIESTEKGSLEIYDMNKFTGGVHQIYDRFGHRTGSEQCREYDIINRKTGAYDHFIVPEKVKYKLEYLFDQIMANNWIRKPSDITEGYRTILGLKKIIRKEFFTMQVNAIKTACRVQFFAPKFQK